MGIGVSVFLLAVGAILAFAIEFSADGIDLNTVGVILMVVGAIGLLASLTLASSLSGRRRLGDTTVVREERF
jgi:hypothetical protein